MTADLLAGACLLAVVSGVWLTFGPGWALIIGGLIALVVLLAAAWAQAIANHEKDE